MLQPNEGPRIFEVLCSVSSDRATKVYNELIVCIEHIMDDERSQSLANLVCRHG